MAIINVTVEMHLKTKEASEIVTKAARLAMRDTVVDIANESSKNSPKLTGNNMRSIRYEASGFHTREGVIDQNKIEGAVYSTSGYGGILETGTYKMAARPYIKPAVDRYVPKFPEKMKGYML
jgi:hypothetical protein